MLLYLLKQFNHRQVLAPSFSNQHPNHNCNHNREQQQHLQQREQLVHSTQEFESARAAAVGVHTKGVGAVKGAQSNCSGSSGGGGGYEGAGTAGGEDAAGDVDVNKGNEVVSGKGGESRGGGGSD
jgi:hypothetical protein